MTGALATVLPMLVKTVRSPPPRITAPSTTIIAMNMISSAYSTETAPALFLEKVSKKRVARLLIPIAAPKLEAVISPGNAAYQGFSLIVDQVWLEAGLIGQLISLSAIAAKH